MNTHELIEKKLDGELTQAEAAEFAQRLRDEPGFAEQYDRYRAAVQGLREQFKHDLRQELEANAGTAPSPYTSAKVSSLRRYWPLAAAALIAVAVGIGWFWLGETVSAEQLADRFYTIYPAGSVVRGDEATLDSARWHYQRQQYAAALPYWQRLEQTDPVAELPLWLGHSYWQTGQLTEAVAYFEQARRSADALVRQHGTWYLALAYLKQGQPERACQLLRALQTEGNLYDREAAQLLQELEPSNASFTTHHYGLSLLYFSLCPGRNT